MQRLKIRDACRSGLNQYTKRAYLSLPEMDNPRILDLGCGTGVPTLELARLTNGIIEAVDTDTDCLDWLEQKISKAGLQGRIRVVRQSVQELERPGGTYDLILMEGLLNIIGFEKGLRAFTPYLKTGGHFMIHDDAKDGKRKLRIMEKLGLQLIDSFLIDENDWWKDYYAPLEASIADFEKYNPEHTESFEQEKSEVAMYKRDASIFRSTYYIVRKEIT